MIVRFHVNFLKGVHVQFGRSFRPWVLHGFYRLLMLHIGLQTGSRFILQQSVGLPNARNKFGSYLVPTTGFSTAPYKGIEGEFWDACENPMLLCQKQELFGVFPPLCKSMKLSYQLLAKMANSGNIPFPCF